MRFNVQVMSWRSGRQVTEFAVDSLEHAANISETLMLSPAWRKCFARCVDLQLEAELFVKYPPGVEPPAPEPEPQWENLRDLPELTQEQDHEPVSGIFCVARDVREGF